LITAKYVEGTRGGKAVSRWLTAGGVDYYEENKHILEIAPKIKGPQICQTPRKYL
jgi:hypothetical protein